MSAKLKGLEEVMTNLNKELDKIKGKTLKGVRMAGAKIKRDSLEMTPEDVGGLRASSYEQESLNSSKERPLSEVGYTSTYAARVHESDMSWKGISREEKKMGSREGYFWDIGENKFLEKAVKKNYSRIIDIIQRYAKIGG